jgi:pimeloyl-ACP methyl ester carboxylesterase
MRSDRRRLLLALAGLGLASAGTASAAPAVSSELEEHELEVPGESLAKRCLVLVPRGAKSSGAQRLLILCHGLGETSSQALGVRAFADRYGLVRSFERLRTPPVARVLKDVKYLTDARLAELNAELGQRPFGGFVIACPFTPNVYKQPSTEAALGRYAAWLGDGVLPSLRRDFGVAQGPAAVAIDGVSLGGYVSLEVFLRRPELFGAVGCMQGAFGQPLADQYVNRFEQVLSRVGHRALRIATSSADGGRAASERLSKRLAQRGIPNTFSVSTGPHDQRWLREVGTLELLLHYDRALPVSASRSEAT